MENPIQPVQEVPNQIPVEQPVIETEKPSMLNSKWLKIGIVVLFVILVLAGTFVAGSKLTNKAQTPVPTPTVARTATPTSDPTVSWKTYTNAELGYSIEYPPTWFTDQIGIYNYDISKAIRRDGFQPGQFKIEIDKNIPTNSIPPGINKVISEQNVNVDGFNATRIVSDVYPNGMPPTYISVFVERQGDNFLFSGYYNEAEKDKYTRVFDQILSTFKFTNESGVIWKVSKSNLSPTELEIKNALSSFNPTVHGPDGTRMAAINVYISTISANFASSSMELIDKNDQVLPTDGIQYYLYKDNGTWNILTGSESNFCNAIKTFPSDILTDNVKSYLTGCFLK